MRHTLSALCTCALALLALLFGMTGLFLTRTAGVDRFVLAVLSGGALLMGGGILFRTLWRWRRRYYRFQNAVGVVSIDQLALQGYLDSYLASLFPRHEMRASLVFRAGGMAVAIDFPPMPLTAQGPLLEKVQRDLSLLLTQRMGYAGPFSMTATFDTAH